MKSLSAMGRLGSSSTHFLFWDPLHTSETNRARELTFRTLVSTYRY